MAAIAEESAELRQIVRSGDDQYLANARQHKHGEGVIDHRLVVHGQQLLADAARDGVKPRSGAAGEDDALALDGEAHEWGDVLTASLLTEGNGFRQLRAWGIFRDAGERPGERGFTRR